MNPHVRLLVGWLVCQVVRRRRSVIIYLKGGKLQSHAPIKALVYLSEKHLLSLYLLRYNGFQIHC